MVVTRFATTPARRRDPFDRRMQDGLRNEDKHGGRQHDLVRDDESLDVGGRNGHQGAAKEDCDRRLPRNAELQDASGNQERANQRGAHRRGSYTDERLACGISDTRTL